MELGDCKQWLVWVHLNLLTLSNTGGSQTEAFGRITERLGMSEGGGGFLLLCMLLLLLYKQDLITTITENILQLGNAMVPDRCLFANTRTVASKACISKHCNYIPSNIRFNLKAVQVMNSVVVFQPDK